MCEVKPKCHTQGNIPLFPWTESFSGLNLTNKVRLATQQALGTTGHYLSAVGLWEYAPTPAC